MRGQSYDPQSTGQTPVNKEITNLESHKCVFEQTPQLYGEVPIEDNATITGNQVPLNNKQDKSTDQLRVNREDSFNQESYKHPLKQTQYFHNEVFTPDNSIVRGD